MYVEPYLIILLFCVAAVFIFRKSAKLLGFNYFILFCFIVEWGLLKYATYYLDGNMLFSNLFVKVNISYYLYLYITQNPRYSVRYAYIIIVCYLLIAFGNFFLLQGMDNLNTYCYNAGMLTVVFFIFRYLFDLLIDQKYVKLTQMPLFWLGIGIILFYCSLFPILTFFNPIMERDPDLLSNLYTLVPIGNIFLYLGYLMFILCPVVIKH